MGLAWDPNRHFNHMHAWVSHVDIAAIHMIHWKWTWHGNWGHTPWSPWPPPLFIFPATLADNLTILQLNCRDSVTSIWQYKTEKHQLAQQMYDRLYTTSNFNACEKIGISKTAVEGTSYVYISHRRHRSWNCQRVFWCTPLSPSMWHWCNQRESPEVWNWTWTSLSLGLNDETN